MTRSCFRFTTIRATLLPLSCWLALAWPAWADDASSFAITDTRVFTGEEVLERATIWVKDGTIRAVGAKVELPESVEKIDGAGMTMLPGLIDCHTHSWGDALDRSLPFGVTTQLDMMTEAGFAASMREEQARGEADDRTDLLSSGFAATVPGGHGTQYGMKVPTLERADEAAAFVNARLAEGSDYLKIISEDGSAWGREQPTLDRATIAALIDAAHAANRLAVVHVSTQERARQAIEDGADGLVHIFGKTPIDTELVRLIVDRGTFVIPTLTVLEGFTGSEGGRQLAKDPELGPYLSVSEIRGLSATFPGSAGSVKHAWSSVAALHRAGVPILAGSDAPNPGTAHGASIHRELELLVAAGLGPTDALAAATSRPAAAFGLTDRGRIAKGLRADLVMVDGDPTADVVATRAIRGVWKGGHRLDRQPTERPADLSFQPGVISTFDDGGIGATFGSGWSESTDAMAGGTSVATMAAVDGGAGDSAGCLHVSGEVRQGFAFPWSGAIYLPGAQPFSGADLSAADTLVFSVRGEPATRRVLMFSTATGMQPVAETFEVTDTWAQHAMPLDGFAGIDRRAITGIFIGAGPDLGSYEFCLDDFGLIASGGSKAPASID